MVLPALIFLIFNSSDPIHSKGWAIPMATDIAFVLGILSLMKNRVPLSLKVFLTTLAIVDDLGAVLTIAFFYTSKISFTYLIIAFSGWLLLWIINRVGVRSFWVFLIIGIFCVWYPLLKSGVHATIAGVLVAFTIPVNRKYRISEFVEKVGNSLNELQDSPGNEKQTLLKSKQYHAVEEIKTHCEKVSSPLQNLEHGLYNFTFYFIMPLFAFANTGIRLGDIEFGSLFQNNLATGIFSGLFLGKIAGIVGFVWIFRKLGLLAFPEGVNWKHIIGAGFLAGIGFTMSIFITDLAFHGDQLISFSKIAILTGSMCAGVVGYFILKRA
jgi:NhaA family Na+:H+ antiporter